MIINLNKYKTLVFDCDGVILNSNKIKTEAFRKTLENYTQKVVSRFIDYHETNGGISRYEKIKYFLDFLAPDSQIKKNNDSFEKILKRYSFICKKCLCSAEIAKNLKVLRSQTSNINWLVASGGDQKELREIFSYKRIDKFFDGGIFGSPDKKEFIIDREIKNNNISKPALFIGDSKLDFFAAQTNKIDFIFLSDWSDFKDYKKFCVKNNIIILDNLNSLIKSY